MTYAVRFLGALLPTIYSPLEVKATQNPLRLLSTLECDQAKTHAYSFFAKLPLKLAFCREAVLRPSRCSIG